MIRGTVAKGSSVLGPNLISAGLAGAALEAAIRHSRKRKQTEWVKHAVAPLSDQLNALRSYNYYGARIMDRGLEDAMALSHMETQRLGGALGHAICNQVLEIVGGSSLMRSSPLQRYFRDSRTAAYLAFPMEQRRALSADVLYGLDAERESPDPATMRWDPLAAYSFRMSTVSAIADGMPEQARERISRSATEEWARAQGLDEVTFEAYLRHRAEVLPQLRPPLP